MNETVIVAGARTPVGSFNGAFSSFSSPQLGAVVIKETVKRAGIDPASINEIIMGCVLQGGLGQAPARQAAIYAGIPDSVSSTTINKVCSSGLKSAIYGAQAIRLGDSDIVLAGGMESMTNAPYYLFKARNGYRMGNDKIYDGMIYDGLWDPYGNKHMGLLGELCAKEYNITREQQDEFAKSSYEKAIEAQVNGYFKEAIVPVEIKDRKGNVSYVSEDEELGKFNYEKALKLKPAFDKEGTITVFNASKINDGAASVMMMSSAKANELGLKPIAKVVAYYTHSQDPAYFTTAPAYAIPGVCRKAGISLGDIDLFEINEAFAVVSKAVCQIAGIDLAKVNVTGGAIALGHPIGASGARLLVTMMYNLKRLNKKLGIVSLCNGGGEATAMIIENLN